MISVIIPVYNVEKFLRNCLDSIISQSLSDWEAILVNDGSTDSSGFICDEYSLKDSRFRVFHKKNGGVSSARNVGLGKAHGEWICFVDSDDRLTPDALSYMLQCVHDTDADVCLCPIVNNEIVCNDKIKILDIQEQKELIWACLAYKTEKYVKNGYMIDAPHGKLFRASLISDNNLRFIEGLSKSEDAIFDAYFYHYSASIVMYNHQVYYYTINPSSLSHSFNWKLIDMLVWVLREEEQFIGTFCLDDDSFRDALYIRAFVGLEQILFEAGFKSLSTLQHIKAVRLYLRTDVVHELLNKLSLLTFGNNNISKPGSSILLFAQKQHSILLYICVLLNHWLFRFRVLTVENIKSLFGIDKSFPFSSIFGQ